MNLNFFKLSLSYLLLIFLFSGCSKDDDNKVDLLPGLWMQEKVTEDGQEISLSDDQKSLSLLIEANGVYRTYAKDALVTKDHYGAWSVTDDTWLEMTADTWHVNADPLSQPATNQWIANHLLTRFTILSLSDEQLEIRLKTYVGDKRYSALFVGQIRPVITADNYDEIMRAYKTLKTYVYTFKRVQ